jgi:hypothetical protein
MDSIQFYHGLKIAAEAASAAYVFVFCARSLLSRPQKNSLKTTPAEPEPGSMLEKAMNAVKPHPV